MAKARATDASQGIIVETWISATGNAEIHSFSTPYPGNIQHHISVEWNAGYPIDFHVYGAIVSEYPRVTYTSPHSDKWDSRILQVDPRGEKTQPMQVSTVTVPARIRATQVEFHSVWSTTPIAANLSVIPEISVDVS